MKARFGTSVFLHHLRRRASAGQVIAQSCRIVALELLMQRRISHICVDQQHLAAERSEVLRHGDRRERLTFAGAGAGDGYSAWQPLIRRELQRCTK